MKTIKWLIISVLFCLPSILCGQENNERNIFSDVNDNQLANGEKFIFWETKQKYSRTYYVDIKNLRASDTNDGSEKKPFKTISKAAEILNPGERVIIREGTYREAIHPLQGGKSSEEMITYEAEKNAKVIVSGSIILKSEEWTEGKGWDYARDIDVNEKNKTAGIKIWQFDFHPEDFMGYNPFGMVNLLHEREAMDFKEVIPDPYFKRRGMVFLDGKPLEQVLSPTALLLKKEGAFWVEHNGMRIHVRFPGDKGPGDFLIEATAKEQVFVPKHYGFGYIKINGITFRHCGNGFPVPQRGMVSSNRGHHWIIENCTIEWANSLGMDIGNEMWYTTPQPLIGFHIVRNNIIRQCGIGGLEGYRGISLLIEDNLFENIGWQDAEFAWESGAIKLHRAENCLIRRNVFRYIIHAPGLWLDYLSNKNCRITKNVFSDITTALGALYVEASVHDCVIDHNIIHRVKGPSWIAVGYDPGGNGCIGSGTDSVRFENNLIIDIENTGYASFLDEWQTNRMVLNRGGIARFHKVTDNIFINCGKHAIEFPNEFNYADGNVYSKMPPGYIKIKHPEPNLKLDMETSQLLFGWEKKGSIQVIDATLDTELLELSLLVAPDTANKIIKAGPFRINGTMKNINIDPRKGNKSDL
ncbi:MAG: right-handed parallel beta-helix repeat-containing protein [Bacteroidales bacterium]